MIFYVDFYLISKQSLKSIESFHIFKDQFIILYLKDYLSFVFPRQDKMFRSLQRLTFFRLSKFQAAAKAIKESGKQQWTQKITPQEQAQLWSLYKQATEGPQADLPPWASNIHEPSSPRYWSRYQGRTKEQAEEDYVQVVKNVLMRHGGEKYIDGF